MICLTAVWTHSLITQHLKIASRMCCSGGDLGPLCCFFLQLFIVILLLKAVGPEVDVCLHSRSKGTWKCHSVESGSSECVYEIVHLWEEKVGTPPAPPNEPQRNKLCTAPGSHYGLWGARSARRQNLPAVVMGSRKCQWGYTRLCFQHCLRPSSLTGSRIPMVWGGLLLPAYWILSGIWVVTGGGHPPRAGKGQRAEFVELSHHWQCWQCSGGWIRDVLFKSGIQVTPAKRKQNHSVLLVQVAEGRKQVSRGRQSICKYPVSFPAYYAM